MKAVIDKIKVAIAIIALVILATAAWIAGKIDKDDDFMY